MIRLNKREKYMSMYTETNFKSKKELKQAVADVKQVRYYQPCPFGGNETQDGEIFVEGPHYPQPHKWYAQCKVKNGVIVSVK